jgi:hypothetical protein
MADPDLSLPAGDPLQSQQAIEVLERQVAEAQAALEQYQGLLSELPGIYEDKFRQKVRSVAEDIRHLLDERKALQEQVTRALLQPRAPGALPPAAVVEPVSAPAPRKWSEVRLPRFPSPSSGASSGGRPPLPRPTFRLRFPKTSPVGVALGAGLVPALLALGLSQLLSRCVVPVDGSPPVPAAGQRPVLASPASLRLEARGAQSWVLVERLGGGKVYDAILEPGQTQELDLGTGLKIRSGRPDLLYVGVGSAPPKPLGRVSDLNWFEFRP